MTEQNHWQNGVWGTGQPASHTPGAPQGIPQPAGQSQGQPAFAAQPQTQTQPQPQTQPQSAPSPYGYGAPAHPAAAYAAPTAAPAAPPKRRGWIVALAAVIAFFVLGLVSIASCTSVMTAPMGAFSYDSPSWTDTVTGDTVGIINIDGTIQYDGTTSSPEGLKAQLDASAAYMISSQANYIYAAETSAVGSIGVIMQVTDVSGLYEKLGITVDSITSADSKDASGGNRPLTEEERAYFQDQVDQINEVFIETVAEGRDMSTDEVRALATGLTFTGLDGVENGLVDEIGTLEDAVAKACELAGIARADTVYLQSPSSDLSRLLDIMGEVDENDLSKALKELDKRGGFEG